MWLTGRLVPGHKTGSDRQQLSSMAAQAKDAMGRPTVATSRVKRCAPARPSGVTPYVPKPLTSGAKADGRFDKQDFAYSWPD
jgi:transposase